MKWNDLVMIESAHQTMRMEGKIYNGTCTWTLLLRLGLRDPFGRECGSSVRGTGERGRKKAGAVGGFIALAGQATSVSRLDAQPGSLRLVGFMRPNRRFASFSAFIGLAIYTSCKKPKERRAVE
jgi:hypothetical protein